MTARMATQRNVLEQVGGAMDPFRQHTFSSVLCILFYFYASFLCPCPLLVAIRILFLCTHIQINIEKKDEGVYD